MTRLRPVLFGTPFALVRHGHISKNILQNSGWREVLNTYLPTKQNKNTFCHSFCIALSLHYLCKQTKHNTQQ